MKAALALIAMLALGACTSPGPHGAGRDEELRALMRAHQVQGMAVAVIDGGQVASVRAYGYRNVQRALPLTEDTVMYGASLTKAAFAYMVLQLADEGRLDLDAPIASLLPRPLPDYRSKDWRVDFADLEGDERWRALTPRILLTHSSGFANFRWLEPDKKLRIHFTPGSRYGYSGEGFSLLQHVLEQGLGLDVGQEMQRRVFDRFGMRNTSMKWRADFAANLADRYGADGAFEPHDERSGVAAAGSMDTSIADQARLWAGIMRGDGLSAASRAELVRPALPIRLASQFPTLAAETGVEHERIGLAAGLGLVTFRDASGPAWFKGGHDDYTGNMVLCLERGQRCVIMLANDVRAERIYPEVARLLLRDTRMPWTWEFGAKARAWVRQP